MRRAFLRLLAKEHFHSKLLDEQVNTPIDLHRMVERHREKTKELERVLGERITPALGDNTFIENDPWKLRRADGTLWP
jgi:hypothetical protein